LIKYMFIVVGPSNFNEVTPSGISTKLENEKLFISQGDKSQDIVPATRNSALLENEAVTSAGHDTEDETTSHATDPNADDSIVTEAVILGSRNKTEYKITQDSIINTDAISEDVECTTHGINGLDSNETAGETSLRIAGLGDMNPGRLGYLVSDDRVKRTPFEQPFGFREILNSTIRDALNFAGTTIGGATGVSTNLAKRARRAAQNRPGQGLGQGLGQNPGQGPGQGPGQEPGQNPGQTQTTQPEPPPTPGTTPPTPGTTPPTPGTTPPTPPISPPAPPAQTVDPSEMDTQRTRNWEPFRASRCSTATKKLISFACVLLPAIILCSLELHAVLTR
jgi:hypothetical protein